MYADYFYSDFLTTLTPLSLYKLKLVDKQFNQVITTKMLKLTIIKEMERRLNIIFKGLDYKKVLENYVISGSFILQCMLEEYWKSDLDIFHVTNTTISSLDNILYDHFDGNSGTCYHDGYGNMDILGSTSFLCINDIRVKKVQIIYTKNKNFTELFDFDFCKNTFYYDNNLPVLELNHIDDIYNKKSMFKSGNDLQKSLKRYVKYKERGFDFGTLTFNNDITDDNIYFVKPYRNQLYEIIDEDDYLDLADRLVKRKPCQKNVKSCAFKKCNIEHFHEYHNVYIIKL